MNYSTFSNEQSSILPRRVHSCTIKSRDVKCSNIYSHFLCKRFQRPELSFLESN